MIGSYNRLRIPKNSASTGNYVETEIKRLRNLSAESRFEVLFFIYGTINWMEAAPIAPIIAKWSLWRLDHDVILDTRRRKA